MRDGFYVLILFCWIGTLGTSTATPILQPAQLDLDRVIDQLQAEYAGIKSFSAEFTQYFTGHNIELRESGILLMEKPGKMYWEYQSPTRKFFVADGKKVYFYVPRDRQVIESDLRLDHAETPLLFLLGKGDVRKDFRVEFEEEETVRREGNLLLRLVPIVPLPEFSYVLLEIDPKEWLIYRLAVVEPIGQRNDYILENLRVNVAIPDRQFRLEVPPGTEVIHQ